MRDQMTLSDRVGRIEDILVHTGIAGDRNEENSMCDRAVTGQRHVNEDKLEGHLERAVKTPEQTAFEEIISRIQSGTDRVCMTASRLEEIGNRVLGPIPENAEDAGGVAKVSPDGTLDHTFIALNWLDQTLCRLHAAAARLERI